MEMIFNYDSDEEEEDFYQPHWFTQRRGFVDLRSIEAQNFNQLISLHLPSEVKQWDCIEEEGWVFEFDHLILNIINSAPAAFDEEPLRVKISSQTIPRTSIDPLRRLARSLTSESLPTCYCSTDLAMLVLRLLEEATATIYEWKNKLNSMAGIAKGWNVNTTTPLDDLYTNPYGADLSTIDTSGNDILGSSIQSICETIPSAYRILHVEPVFREDLVSRFKRRRHRIARQLAELPYSALQRCVPHNRFSSAADKSDLIEELCKPHVTFHGTQRNVVSSIVRHGFLVPGERIGEGKDAPVVEIVSGASYGIGIYSSPSAEYALCYANMSWDIGVQQTRPEDLPGLRLIVCAVLMGRPLLVTREETRRTLHLADPTANSHVSPNQLEYIVFHKTQIVPCYVLHLDLGADTAKRALAMAPSDPDEFVRRPTTRTKIDMNALWPAEIEALKAARKAAAAKWFPYGFGPAKGTRFVIEEIGETSDDEEEYGEYQAERKEVGNEITEWKEQQEKSGGGSWLDEYQNVRWTYRRNVS